MMQWEDGIRDHVWVVVEAVDPAVVCLRWLLLVEDVWKVPFPSDNLNLVSHESLVEAHAHVTFQKVVAFVGEGRVGGQETKSNSEFSIQAVFDIGLREALQCGQAGPECSDSSHLSTKMDLGSKQSEH